MLSPNKLSLTCFIEYNRKEMFIQFLIGWLVGWLVILINGISTLAGYLVPNLVFCIYDLICINKPEEMIFIIYFSWCGWHSATIF